MGNALCWPDWLVAREALRQRALCAGPALLAGDLDPAAALLGDWSFGADAHLVEPLLLGLRAGLPSPSPRALACNLGLPPLLARTPAPAAAWLHRARLRELPIAPVADTPDARASWALVTLAELAQELDERFRGPWRAARYPAQPEDEEVSGIWRALATDPWACRDAFERHFLPVALRAFGAVLEAVGFHHARRRERLADVQDSLFFLLLGRGEQAGWRGLAARVIETAGGPPVGALAGALDAPSWEQVSRCAVARGHGHGTAALLWPDLQRISGYTRHVASALNGEPARLETLCDLHIAWRLIRVWSAPERTEYPASWRVVTQNLGRARGRLRAVLRQLPGAALIDQLSTLRGIAARTRAAVGRMCRDWAWAELRLGLPIDADRSIDATCAEARAETDFSPALRTWVLLVALRGRLGHLQRWVERGSTGDKDATWGRLLTVQAPLSVRSPGVAGLHELRTTLGPGLPQLLADLRPRLCCIAAISPEQPDLAAAVEAALRPGWHESVPLPRARLRELLAHARDALATFQKGDHA